MTLEPTLLRAALIGYENQLAQIDKAMSDIRRQLKGAPPAGSAPGRTRRRAMSAAARRRIAAAQKKRWAAYRKTKASK